jgi:hypothetical protein
LQPWQPPPGRPRARLGSKLLLGILDKDRDRLERIDNYLHGDHDDPYMPVNADDEYRLLAERCISNWMPLLVGTPAQAMYVDTFRRGSEVATKKDQSRHPEWDALGAAGSAPASSPSTGRAHLRPLLHPDREGQGQGPDQGPVGPEDRCGVRGPGQRRHPYAAHHRHRWPSSATDGNNGDRRRRARPACGTASYEYQVTFKALSDKNGVRVWPASGTAPASARSPGSLRVDLEGRTLGVIEPMIALQNRINQTVFDLLVAQTYASTMVRTVTGMAPP